MFRQLKSLFGVRANAAPGSTPASGSPRPEQATYIVGDIHGRADLLELVLELIDAHIGGSGASNPNLVFLGDYIDHGPESAESVARLRELTAEFPDNVTCLMGCHERMLLDFLDDPALRGPRWIKAGGGATLDSFGLSAARLDPGAPPEDFVHAADQLRDTMPDGALDWIGALPLSWCSGNLCAVHAGADPQRPFKEQSARVLLWGHPEFDTTPRSDGLWIAHGHTPVETPDLRHGRITLDTDAWSTGRLTACAIRPDGQYDFLQT